MPRVSDGAARIAAPQYSISVEALQKGKRRDTGGHD